MVQEPWTYDERTLSIYRSYVLLHEQLVPYIRAAAATGARSGLPIIRPLHLADPARRARLDDRRRVRLRAGAVGRAGARGGRARARGRAAARRVDRDVVGRSACAAGARSSSPAPRSTIPVWVRRGSIVVTYPAAHVAAGLGDTPEAERPLEATLWGEPRARARARRGWPTARGSPGGAARWSVDRPRDVVFRER